MANYFSSHFTLGILGGGQLGKMLLYDTRKFDIRTHVLDPSAEAPCKIACDYFEQGDLMDYDTVYAFGKKVDVLTFEIEGVNVDALEKLEAEGTVVYPSANTLRKIQDKGIQKKFLQRAWNPNCFFLPFWKPRPTKWSHPVWTANSTFCLEKLYRRLWWQGCPDYSKGIWFGVATRHPVYRWNHDPIQKWIGGYRSP